MMGFALGDGYFPQKDSRDAQWMQIFPHHTKDLALFDKFLNVCSRHGIVAKQRQVNKHVTRVTDGVVGYPCIQINHKEFSNWLRDIGFINSCSNREIPKSLYAQPAWIREAVLRGLFSADGHRRLHVTGTYTIPTLFSACDSFQTDIIRCLWSVGVASNLMGTGWHRAGEVVVQDVRSFVDRIGFLQDYKNENISRVESHKDMWDRVAAPVAYKLADAIKSSEGWSALDKKDRDLVCKVSRKVCLISRPRAIAIYTKLGLDIPESLQYCNVKVDVLDKVSRGTEQMYDVEVFDDRHLFLANHMCVHNTQGSNAKGIINLKGDNMSSEQLEVFKREWAANVAGIESAWRTPILQTELGVDWIDLSKSNSDMEFSKWMEYLIKIVTGIYSIDPAEINFDLAGGVAQTPLFESSSEWKLKASRDKGLKPLLKFIAKYINDNIVAKIDDAFYFDFVGLDELTEQEKHELRTEQLASYMTLNETRRALDLPDIGENGDIVL